MFDRIVVVDWSANGTPKRGADSIWAATLDVTDDTLELVNHPTRHACSVALLDVLGAPGRTLLGVDFALGFPQGFADAVGRGGAARPGDWLTVWAHLAAHLHDDERNRNDRWAVAREWNRTLERNHFWGAPAAMAGDHLPATRPEWTGAHLPAFRVPEARLRANGLRPFSVWQLLGAGSVGSQTLTGIPMLHRLRHHDALAERMRVWPFETGLATVPTPDAIVVAEVWPSATPFHHVDHPVKDARQVVALARHLAALDAASALDALFSPALSAAETDAVVREEGWVLGLE